MNEKQATKISKFLSLVLRHEPAAAGLRLDAAGWADVAALLKGCAARGISFSRKDLEHVVATNSKKRFELSPEGTRIRASQGHSVPVDLDYKPALPPERLYHGTATRFLGSIMATGLEKRQRHHVHLSTDLKTAQQVGGRHGKPVVLTVAAGEMQRAGHEFFRSTNGVWLVESVPPEYLKLETNQ